MRAYIFLCLASLACIAASQRFELPPTRSRSFAPREGRRRLRVRGPESPRLRPLSVNDFPGQRDDSRSSRPQPAPPSPPRTFRFQDTRPGPIDTSSILQQAIARHRPRPQPIDPEPIQEVRPSILPQQHLPPRDDFEPTTFKSTHPRPLPLNLDKILQIPKFENEAEAQDVRKDTALRPSLPPLGNTFPRKESHFDEALRQVLEGPAPAVDSDSFRIPSRGQSKFAPPREEFAINEPRVSPPRQFSPISPSPSPLPSPAPTPVNIPAPRPKPIRVDQSSNFPEFRAVKTFKQGKPIPVVKVARPSRPVQTRPVQPQTFIPSEQSFSRPKPSRGQSQFVPRQQPSRQPAPRPELFPEQDFVVNRNQHLSLTKEEQLANVPIDSQQAKIRNEPIRVIKNFMHRNDDGTFTWGYEGEDGSFKEETRGKDCIVRGKYGYVDPAGVRREFTYETGNPCDPDAIQEQQDTPLGGYYDYDKGVFVTAKGKEIPLNVKGAARSRRL